jgi:beta-N-acetylhexosaminidase
MALVGHAAYPAVTKDNTPASISRKWITDILRKRIGYRGLVVSDDLEMGGVLKAVSIGQAAVGHIRAGGDLAMVCHIEENVVRCHEALVREFEKDARFARRSEESIRRVLAFKKKSAEVGRHTAHPTPAKVARLTRKLWEFSEQVRLEALSHKGLRGRRR